MTRASAALGAVGAAAAAGLAYLTLGAGLFEPSRVPPVTPASRSQVASSAGGPAPNSQVSPAPARAAAPVPSRSSVRPSATETDPPRPSTEVVAPSPTITTPTSFAPMTPAPAMQSLPAPLPAPSASATDTPRTVSIKKDAVIGVRLDQAVAADTSQVDDPVTARVARDVTVDSRPAIPAGARLEGAVTLVERGDSGRIGVRFHTLVLGDGQRLSIQTDTIFRDREPAPPSAAVGARGAVGAIVSGASRTAPAPILRPTTSVVPSANQMDARIPAGSLLTVRLMAPLVIDPGGR